MSSLNDRCHIVGIRPYDGRNYMKSGDGYHTNPHTGEPGKPPSTCPADSSTACMQWGPPVSRSPLKSPSISGTAGRKSMVIRPCGRNLKEKNQQTGPGLNRCEKPTLSMHYWIPALCYTSVGMAVNGVFRLFTGLSNADPLTFSTPGHLKITV